MSEDPSYLRLGFVIAVLGMAGISYWVVQERSQSTALTKNVAEAPAPAMQKPAQNPLPASESSVPDAGASPAAVVENRVPPPEPPAREEKPLDKPTAASPTETPNLQEGPTTESASATTAGQSEGPAGHRSRLRGISFRNQPKRQHLLRRRPVLWRQPYPQKTK